LDEVAATAFYANQPEIGYQASKVLLEKNLAPALHKQRVLQNFRSYEQVMKKIEEQKKYMNSVSTTSSDNKQKKEPNKNKQSTRVKEKTGYKKRRKQKA
jgi:hypothetical protein